MPKVLDSYEFVDDNRNRWPNEWFDGQIRLLSPADLRIDAEPESEEEAKQLTARRGTLSQSARHRGLKAKANWAKDGRSLVFQALPDANAKAKKAKAKKQ